MGNRLKLQDEILVVDLETTCWEKDPPPGEIADIIEIGVAHLDITSLAITSNWSTYVIPTRSKITPYSVNLNGITDEVISMIGVPLLDAFNMLEQAKSRTRTWASWGNFDRKKMETDARSTEFVAKFGAEFRYPMSPRHLNVKALFTVCFDLDKEPSMDVALEIMGWKLEGRHHSGKDDAKNIARILGHLLGRIRLPQG